MNDRVIELPITKAMVLRWHIGIVVAIHARKSEVSP
jgi:hypothetical protein